MESDWKTFFFCLKFQRKTELNLAILKMLIFFNSLLKRIFSLTFDFSNWTFEKSANNKIEFCNTRKKILIIQCGNHVRWAWRGSYYSLSQLIINFRSFFPGSIKNSSLKKLVHSFMLWLYLSSIKTTTIFSPN